MRPKRAHAGWRAALPLAMAVGVSSGAAAQEQVGSAEVSVSVDATGRVNVVARFTLPSRPPSLELRALARACADVDDVEVTLAEVTRPVAVEPDGPWLVVPIPAGNADGASLDVRIRYGVRAGAPDVDVPLFHPTVPIPQRDGERAGAVHVEVRFPDGSGRVAFPHMDRSGPAAWSGRYVGVPSFVELAGAPAGEAGPDCTGPAAGPWSDGGLTWRFLLLVGIMVVWVPIYQAWARRSTEDGA